jgi:hypothetical protein
LAIARLMTLSQGKATVTGTMRAKALISGIAQGQSTMTGTLVSILSTFYALGNKPIQEICLGEKHVTKFEINE